MDNTFINNFSLKNVRIKRNKVTPTLLLLGRAGHLRKQTFGYVTDLQLGAEVARLMAESRIP
jgi:hypothetical protein